MQQIWELIKACVMLALFVALMGFVAGLCYGLLAAGFKFAVFLLS